MIVYEGKLKGKDNQYRRLDEAIRTGLFIRNTCLRYWEDGHGRCRNDFSKYCTILGKSEEFPWAGKLNSQARQAMSERTWAAISRFFENCKNKVKGKKGYPKYKKNRPNHGSVEYKTSGWVRFVSSKNGEYKFKVYEEQEFNLSYRLNKTLDNLMTMRVQVPLHRRNGKSASPILTISN
ncbi:transposase [Coleofasciculus sp.]|uniref:transposase n=1 Tax=Coleofasciculus sp. TaxID=3100458 RepID=UPI003A417D69